MVGFTVLLAMALLFWVHPLTLYEHAKELFTEQEHWYEVEAPVGNLEIRTSELPLVQTAGLHS